MNKLKISVVILLLSVLAGSLPLSYAITNVPAPNVTLPNSNWQLMENKPYPNNVPGIHDEGSGYLEYENGNSYVLILYENALNTNPSNNDLTTDAVRNFQAIETLLAENANSQITSSGITTAAGVTAGFAKGTFTSGDIDLLVEDFAFVKGSVYFLVYGVWDANLQNDQVLSLVNSISTTTSAPVSEGTVVAIVVLVVAATAVVVFLVLYLKVIKPQKRQPAQFTFAPAPPPPPPT